MDDVNDPDKSSRSRVIGTPENPSPCVGKLPRPCSSGPLRAMRTEWRLFLAFFALLMISYWVFGGYRNWPYKIESDGKYYYQYLVSAIYDGDLDFSNQYRTPKYPWMRMPIDIDFQKAVSPKTGRPANPFPPGVAVLWAPFFLLSWLLGTALGWVGFRIEMAPFGRWFQFGVMTAGPTYAALALVILSRLIARLRMVARASSSLALLLILLASPLYYYAVFEPSMSHVYDLFTFVLYLICVLRWLDRRGACSLAALTLAGAAFIWVRPQNAVTVALFSGALLWVPGRGQVSGWPGRIWGRLFASALPLVCGVLPILAVNAYLYGGLVFVSQGANFIDLGHPAWYGVLLSARNGLFSHHPLLLLGLIGFVALLFSRQHAAPKWFLWTLAAALLAQVHLNSCVGDWWGGHSFGQRRLVSSLVLFTIGLAFLMEKLRRCGRGRFGWPVLVPAGLVCVLGFYLVLIHVFLWNYNQPHDIARWMFVIAPRLFAHRH